MNRSPADYGLVVESVKVSVFDRYPGEKSGGVVTVAAPVPVRVKPVASAPESVVQVGRRAASNATVQSQALTVIGEKQRLHV